MSAHSLMGVRLYMSFLVCCFSHTSFNIPSFSLIFAILITMCFSVFLFGLVLNGTLHFLGLDDCFLSHVREIFSYYVSKYVLSPFVILFLSGTSIM